MRSISIVSALAICLALGEGLGTAPASAQPPNDLCINRVFNNVEAPKFYSTLGATLDGPATTSGCDSGTITWGNDIWYEFIPGATGTWLINLCQGTDFDAAIAVYTNGTSTCACPTNNSTLVACADDGCGDGGLPALPMAFTQGQCYLIRVGGISQGSGTFSIWASSPTAVIAPKLRLSPGKTAYIDLVGFIRGAQAATQWESELLLSALDDAAGVHFTSAPPTDIVEIGDPWPEAGTFTAYDTDEPGYDEFRSRARSTNGTGIPAPVSFAGILARFPITVSPTAFGDFSISISGGWDSIASGGLEGLITIDRLPCVNAADCDDDNDCTVDSCSQNLCNHVAVTPGTACGSPANDDCTDPDICDADGFCQRNDQPDGTACTSSDACVVGESCNAGFCVGTRTSNCCSGLPDCDDHNPCTTESCAISACSHTPVAAGTACGSGVDDACTDPDTCDANGNCLSHDVADGTLCGGLQCQGGQCGSATYSAAALPEESYIGSEPRDGFVNDISADLIVVGRVIDSGQVDHAAVWTCDSNGGNCTLEVFEEADGSASVANSVACDDEGTCSFVLDISTSLRRPGGPSKGNKATSQQAEVGRALPAATRGDLIGRRAEPALMS